MPNYFMLKTTILCLPFYYIGIYIKKRSFLVDDGAMSRIPLWILIMGFISSLVFSYINGTVYLTTCDVSRSYILFLMSSIIGCICLFCMLQRLTRKSFSLIETISEGTLLIMSLHYLLIKPIVTFIPLDGFWGWMVDSMIIMGITTILVYLSKKYCPVLIGKKNILK